MEELFTQLVAIVASYGAGIFGDASLAGAPVSALVVSFFIYAAIGWLWESTVCGMLNTGHFVNSGFLLGPCCPIYGVGAVAAWLLLRQVTGVVSLFICSMAVCTMLEYIIGVLLEKFTGGQRFWDYSDMPFNVQGRVCLYGALMFGAACVLVCRVAQPAILRFLGLFPPVLVVLASTIILVVLAVDLAFAAASYRSYSQKLEAARAELRDAIDAQLAQTSEAMLEKIPDDKLGTAHQVHVTGRAINGWLAEFSDAAFDAVKEKALPSKVKFTWGERRFFNAFPNLKFNKFDALIRATALKVKVKEKLAR